MAMHALARLIEDVMASNGWNRSEVGRRIGMTRGRVGQIIDAPVRAVPSRDTIVHLARGLGVPPWVVMDAYLESIGLPTRPTHIDVEEAIRADAALNAGDKRAILAFIEHIRSQPSPDFDNVQGLRVAEDPPSSLRRADTPED